MMLQPFLAALLPTIISVAIFLAVGFGAAHYHLWKNKKRWSPLTSKLLRSPGHQLVQELDDINFDITAALFAMWLIPLVMYTAHISGSYFSHQPESLLRFAINAGAVLIGEIYAIRKLLRLLEGRTRIREGYEAESAVGSELNQLMLDGAQVFHDLQAEGFNIDHVVVSPKGVFCIETKSRVKHAAAEDKPNVKVEFDGTVLKFPHHVETSPVEQVRMNSKWLQSWLTQAVGEPISARPVLALPGWFITTTNRTEVLAINGKNCRGFFSKVQPHQLLSEAQIQRIVHQVEQRCRDVEPTRYRKAGKKSP
jgi:hypothetical protein